MHQHGETYRQRTALGSGAIERHHDMDPGIDFRMVVGALRYPEQGIEFRQQAGEGAALAQHLDHA